MLSLSTARVYLRKTNFMIAALVVPMALYAPAATAADAAQGEKLSQTCLGCHGAPGLRNPAPVYNVPMIGGQHQAYIVSALKAYKNKTRSHGTMLRAGSPFLN